MRLHGLCRYFLLKQVLLLLSTCRSPSGAAMLTRITQLMNSVLADVLEAEPVTEQQVIDLVGEEQSVAS